MINRRTLLLGAAGATTLAASLPAWATGGDDPMPGIDIIIKLDPSGDPIKPTSLTKAQLEKLNGMNIEEGVHFLSKIIADHLHKAAPDCCGKVSVKDISAHLGKEWCGPCKMVNEVFFKVPMGDSTLLITLLIKR